MRRRVIGARGKPCAPFRGRVPYPNRSIGELAWLRRLRRLAGGDVAGEREADAAGAAGLLAGLLGDGRVGLLGLLVGEDLLGCLAREQPLELVGVERLVLDQDLRHRLELGDVRGQHLAGPLVGRLDDAADLVVDLARDLLGVVGLVAEVATQEGLRRVAAEGARPELLGHAPAGDHPLGGVGRLVEVVLGAGRDLAEDELLGRAAAQVLGEVVEQLGPRAHELVLARQRDHVAEGHAAPDDRDLVHGVVVRQVVADERVPHLVDGGDLALLGREQPGLLLGAGGDAHDALFELEVLDLLLALAGVGPASASTSTVWEIGLPRVCTSRIFLRPTRSGRSTTTWRSKRPGRRRAGSRMSGRLVAAIKMTLSFISKPSISTRSWFSVCSRSSWPPPMPAPRWRPTASISSMKMMQGEFCLACSNRSRTRLAPTPTNISTKSEPEIEKNGTPASPATARARSVLPVPGGPKRRTPFGMRAPSAWNFF